MRSRSPELMIIADENGTKSRPKIVTLKANSGAIVDDNSQNRSELDMELYLKAEAVYRTIH